MKKKIVKKNMLNGHRKYCSILIWEIQHIWGVSRDDSFPMNFAQFDQIIWLSLFCNFSSHQSRNPISKIVFLTGVVILTHGSQTGSKSHTPVYGKILAHLLQNSKIKW